ncbi:hypothetical protein SAMN06297129_1813 [Pseudooceanicola antarcticus]|uniref:DUF2946 domain-containing protein n=1 Tax=Pseudooceanicola antarcticus TaxID=1247613 RepID=A0A285IQT9_9RHOB|nr:hypothetical protein [Pseudooceanicola antarcticus]PJE31787.1 hypothetical protein CVM39_01395 [Pseudooceanicola antarcticus]SNY50390.1 hypothetical protein SAMN06297129_1813 [Pseudooceanicola antarcticus]
MLTAPRRLVVLCLLVLTLAWGALLSSAHMAPSADEIARASSVLALEPGNGSICADGTEAQHAHHCPFCHALPESPALGIAPAVSRMVFALAGPALRLAPVPAAPPRRANTPRAPPLFLA